MVNIIYFSLTGQTRRFINKTKLSAYELTKESLDYEANEPYLLVVPTYEHDALSVVSDFLRHKKNASYMQGIVGGGNRNFGDAFVHSAKEIARDYDVPLVFAFEFNGTNEDVENFRKVVMNFES